MPWKYFDIIYVRDKLYGFRHIYVCLVITNAVLNVSSIRQFDVQL